MIDEARKFGLTTPIPAYPSIFIGAADVYPIEMVAAYSAFAANGNRAPPVAITKVEDQKGNTLWAPEPTVAPVMSPEEAWLMVSVMKDVVRRGTAAGSVGSQISCPAGGKTGTTNDGTNVWFIGYTSDLVAGVWMGFDRPQKIKANAQGGILAAPAWTSFMNEVYKRKPMPKDWAMPAGIVTKTIDVTTQHARRPVLSAQRDRQRVLHLGYRSGPAVRQAYGVYRFDRRRALSAGRVALLSHARDGAAGYGHVAGGTAGNDGRRARFPGIAAAFSARHLPSSRRVEHLCFAAAPTAGRYHSS